MISEEALVAYYEIRARAEQRYEAAHGSMQVTQDDLRDRIESASEELYRERLGSLRDLAIGEIGVGNGDFIRHALKERARTIVLIDISKDRISALSEELKALDAGTTTKLIVANAQRMEGVDDAELDLLVAKEVIEHLTDYRPFLNECRRVLRKGGRLYLTTPNRHCIDLWPRTLLSHLAPAKKLEGDKLVQKVFDNLLDYVHADEREALVRLLPAGFKEHIHEFAPGELLRALSAHGFRVERRWGTPPQMFYHELRPFAERLLPRWIGAEHQSYALGDDLRLIAERL